MTFPSPNPTSLLYEGAGPFGPNEYLIHLETASNDEGGGAWKYRIRLNVSSVPEPGTAGLLSVGLVAGWVGRRGRAGIG